VDPVVILSPHLDDAVLSCGQLMAGRPDVLVVTVMAGIPTDRVLRPFDRLCGFMDGYQAVVGRRLEDTDAVTSLHGRAYHLDFVDHQYDEPNDFDRLKTWVAQLVEEVRPEYVLAPVGLAHPDHATTTRAAIQSVPWAQLRFYEELPARVLWPELVAPALENLVRWVKQQADVTLPTGSRFHLERDPLGTGDLARKQAAVKRYVSQRAVLAQLEDGAGLYSLSCPERFWKVVPG